MKRYMCLFLALVSLLSLCACGLPEVNPTPTKEPEPIATEEPDPIATEDPQEQSDAADVLVNPVYPEMPQCPDPEEYVSENGWSMDDAYYDALSKWNEAKTTMREMGIGAYSDGLKGFYGSCVSTMLAGNDTGDNLVFSPLSIYFAVSMLAETTNGETQQQLFDMLGVSGLDELRAQARGLWMSSYQKDGVTTSVLADSMWLSSEYMHDYNKETLQNLSDYYYASSHAGEMGSDAYNKALQNWVNENTGNMLTEQASGLKMDKETFLALVSTVYFKAPWSDNFSSNATTDDVFHTICGDVTVPFMHKADEMAYYWGEHFSAIALPMDNGGDMWFIRPDDDYTLEDLLDDEEACAFFLSDNKSEWENQKHLRVVMSIPKFDVSSDFDIIDAMKEMGVSDVFIPDVADFSPLSNVDHSLYVSSAKHAARAVIDEEGCEAAAFTVIMVTCGAAAPSNDEVEFVLDRPFLFTITNANEVPMFIGTVYNP